MDRLTERGAGCLVSIKPGYTNYQVADRLAAYEETGLEPEEIKDSIGWMSPVCVRCDGKTSDGVRTEKCGYPDDITKCLEQSEHIRDLLQAEQAGRLVVLPEPLKRAIVREGGRCFSDFTMDDINNLLEAWDAGRLVVLPCKVGDTIWRIKRSFAEWPDISKPYVEADAFLYRDIHYFGKTVFLTREEAEAALSKTNTIPCKHGLSRHRNEIGEDEVYCELNAKWMNVSLGDCLGNCESEAALAGKGGDD